jgi:hypothetical protein
VDNGDATSHDSFQAKERNAYNGLVLVIVRTKKGEVGAITLQARSEGSSGSGNPIAKQSRRIESSVAASVLQAPLPRGVNDVVE